MEPQVFEPLKLHVKAFSSQNKLPKISPGARRYGKFNTPTTLSPLSMSQDTETTRSTYEALENMKRQIKSKSPTSSPLSIPRGAEAGKGIYSARQSMNPRNEPALPEQNPSINDQHSSVTQWLNSSSNDHPDDLKPNSKSDSNDRNPKARHRY